MPANTAPIYTAVPHIEVGGAILGPTANTNLDGTSSSTSITRIFTAGSNGSFISHVKLKAVGSPAQTVIRFFICTDTGSFTAGTTNTAANTSLYFEMSVPAVTVSQTSGTQDLVANLNLALPASYKLLISFGTSTGASGTGYAVTVVGGDY